MLSMFKTPRQGTKMKLIICKRLMLMKKKMRITNALSISSIIIIIKVDALIVYTS